MIKGALVCATWTIVYLEYKSYKLNSILRYSDETTTDLICACLKGDYAQVTVEKRWYMEEVSTTPDKRADSVRADIEYIFPLYTVDYNIVGERRLEYEGEYTTTFKINNKR